MSSALNAVTFDPTEVRGSMLLLQSERLGTSEGSSEESIFRVLNSTAKVQFSLLKFSKYKATPPFLRSSEFSDSLNYRGETEQEAAIAFDQTLSLGKDAGHGRLVGPMW